MKSYVDGFQARSGSNDLEELAPALTNLYIGTTKGRGLVTMMQTFYFTVVMLTIRFACSTRRLMPIIFSTTLSTPDILILSYMMKKEVGRKLAYLDVLMDKSSSTVITKVFS